MILCVSYNSATQNVLAGRGEEDTEMFHKNREKLTPNLVLSLEKMEKH